MPYTLSKVCILTNDRIDEVIDHTSPGVYALDRTTIGPFHVNYVGRSDSNLSLRLKDWVGTRYKYFKFDYADTPQEAFEKECELWHDFGGPQGEMDSKIHPERAEHSNWKCPRCDKYGCQSLSVPTVLSALVLLRTGWRLRSIHLSVNIS